MNEKRFYWEQTLLLIHRTLTWSKKSRKGLSWDGSSAFL
jgi:hypothetical protein